MFKNIKIYKRNVKQCDVMHMLRNKVNTPRLFPIERGKCIFKLTKI